MNPATQEIEQWIAEHGSARDALNVALARLKVSDEDAEKFIDGMWRDIIIKHHPDYGDWEYPAQAHRYLLAEFNDLHALIATLKAERDVVRDAALVEAHDEIWKAISGADGSECIQGLRVASIIISDLRTTQPEPEAEEADPRLTKNDPEFLRLLDSYDPEVERMKAVQDQRDEDLLMTD